MASADAASSPSDAEADVVGPRPPQRAGFLALALFGAAFLPMHPNGDSVAVLVAQAFGDGVLPGITVLTSFGAPYLLGALIAAAAFTGAQPASEKPLRMITTGLLALFHAHLVLLAFTMVRHGLGLAPLSLLGFGVIGGVYFSYRSALARAEGERDAGLDLAWMAKWGGAMIAPVAAWARLQMLADVRLGIAVDVTLLAAIGVLLTVRTPPPARDAL